MKLYMVKEADKLNEKKFYADLEEAQAAAERVRLSGIDGVRNAQVQEVNVGSSADDIVAFANGDAKGKAIKAEDKRDAGELPNRIVEIPDGQKPTGFVTPDDQKVDPDVPAKDVDPANGQLTTEAKDKQEDEADKKENDPKQANGAPVKNRAPR